MPDLQPTAAAKRPALKKTLAAVIGSIAAAAGLFTLIPRYESGRTVEAKAQADGSVTVTHVAGPQYLKAYLDIIGVPTACDGITKGIRMGQVYSPTQCTALLEQELISHAEPIIKCIPTLYGRDNQVIAAVSLSYNIGAAGVCKSSIARLWNARQWRAGCDRFPLFNKAGGRVSKGLSNRRAQERAICVRGLSA
jgi:lysozyme